jgi:hypothetical protein
VTVKEELFAVWLFTVTEKRPDVAPVGTSTDIAVLLQLVTTALVEFNDTVLPPCCAPKFEPVIVTWIPTGPAVGEMLVIAGACARA